MVDLAAHMAVEVAIRAFRPAERPVHVDPEPGSAATAGRPFSSAAVALLMSAGLAKPDVLSQAASGARRTELGAANIWGNRGARSDHRAWWRAACARNRTTGPRWGRDRARPRGHDHRDFRSGAHPAVQRGRQAARLSAGRAGAAREDPRCRRGPDRHAGVQPGGLGGAQERHRLGLAAARPAFQRQADRDFRREPRHDRHGGGVYELRRYLGV